LATFGTTSAFRHLAESRTGWIAAAVVALFSGLAAWTPLLRLPGYELSEALTLLGAMLAGPLVVSLAIRDRPWSPLRAAFAAAVWLGLFAGLSIGGIALHAALATRCSPFTGLPFAFLLPFPAIFLGTALAGGCAALLPKRRQALVLYGAVILGLLVHAAWGGYFGPQAFGYDHLLGYFPGPLYDEDLQVPMALWWFRALTLGLIASSFAFLAIAPRFAVAAFGLLVWVTNPLEHRIGTRSSVADLDRALGNVRSFEGLTLHAPRELDRQRLDQLWHAAVVSRAQVADALGVPESTPVDVFFHRSAAEKARLTGAGQTHFTKPWLGQIETEVDAPQVLRHEMVHALAAPLGGGPFGVGKRLLFSIGIVEGLAEAVDWPADRYTLDEWCAALRAAGQMPSARSLLAGSGHFYATPQAQAYTVTGAFMHWLLATRGKGPVAALYRSEDFTASLGEPLSRLSDEFEDSLATVAVSPQLAHVTAERFRARPIFARPCAREVAELRDEASQAEGREEDEKAAELFSRCAALDPSDPRYLEGRWRSLREAKSPEAASALAELLQSPATDDAVRARVAVIRGDQDALVGRTEEARTAYREAQELGLDLPSDRAVQIRMQALDAPDLAEPLHRYFEGPRQDVALLGLSEAAEAHPLFGPLRYLIGIALANRGEPAWSLDELDKALALGVPDDLAAQALRVEVDDALRTKRYDRAAEAVARLHPLASTPAAQRQSEDLISRLAIERRHFEEPTPTD
jgi:hypothetical protein